jgi:DNA-directed RNA polymerase specialized sigma24 family protein
MSCFDEQVFTKIVSEEMPYLRSIAARYTARYEDVDDVVQTALCAVLQRKNSINTPGATRSYVIGAVLKSSLKQFNSNVANKKRHTTLEHDGEWVRKVPAQLTTHETPETMLLLSEMPGAQQRLDAALNRLSPARRQHFIDWQNRGYVSYTRAQKVAVSQSMALLRKVLKTSGKGRNGKLVRISQLMNKEEVM